MIATHITFGAYGFWLPNDPRGSWSDTVRSPELLRHGAATKTIETQSVAHVPHDHARRLAAKADLKFKPVRFTGIQARAIGRGFAAYAAQSGLTIHACAIMPDHIHLVVAEHRLTPKSLTIQLKGHAVRQLVEEGIHPLADHQREDGRVEKCFATGEWIVYLDTANDVLRATQYVEENPEKGGLRRQTWWFVKPFQP